MRVGAVFLVLGAVVALTTGCGKIRHPAGKSAARPAVGGSGGLGGMSTAGSGVVGGAGAMSTADSGEGGMPPDGSGGSGGMSVAGTGGTSPGGASSGAPATAGAGQAGGLSIAVPEGCVPGVQHVGGEYCSAEMSCDGARLTVSCAMNDAGLWTCSCSDGNVTSSFDFIDTTGTRTCELAGEACAHPQPLGEERCETTHELEGDLCTAHTICRQQAEGAPIALRTDSIATCQWTSELAICQCNAPADLDYYLAGFNFADGCNYLGPLCKDGPMPTSDWTCDPTLYPGTMGYGCSGSTRCERPIVLSDEMPLTQVQYFYAGCIVDGDQTRCDCSGGNSAGKDTFLVGLPEESAATCQATLDACSGAKPFELEGSPDCVPTTETFSPTTCTHAFECTQAGKTGDLDVTLLTNVSATCDHRSDDKWACSCNGYITQLFELEARSVSEACDDALAQCPHVPRGLQ